MHVRHSFGLSALALAFLLLSTGGIAAQEPPIDFDAAGGLGFAVGDLGDVADGAGPAFDVGVNFGLTDRFRLRLHGGAELYEGIDLGGPVGNEGINDLELDLIHFHGGGFWILTPSDDGPLSVNLTTTAGFTNFNVPRVAASVGTDAIEFEISELFPSVAAGASVGYAVHEQVDLFLDAKSFVVFGDEENEDVMDMLQVVNDVSDEPVESLGTMWSVPVTAGVRLHF